MSATTPAKKTPAKKAPAKKATTKAPATAEVEANEEITTVIVTVQGLDLVIPKGVLNDFELMEHVMAVDMGDPNSIVHAGQGLRMILGLDQHAIVMDHLRDKETGRAEIAVVLSFFVELIQEVLPNS